MHRFGRVRWVILVQAAATALIAGHALDYWIVVPDSGHRRAMLDLTGHGYLSTWSSVAAILGVAAVMASIGSGILRRACGSNAPTWRAIALRLAAIQCSGFLVMETAERLASGAPLATLTGQLIVAGLVTQVAVALATAAALLILESAGAAISAILADRFARSRPPIVLGREPDHVVLRDRFSASSLRSRAPPLLPSSA